MEIRRREKTVREVTAGFRDNGEDGAVGFGGRLTIRPSYQREFVYDDERRKAVIDTVQKGFPLNAMYWSEGEDSRYELLDGQQRTLSICQYVNGDFSLHGHGFYQLPESEQERFLDYRLTIYICRGDEREKLEWFRRINLSGLCLTVQEMRNAMYPGPWLSDAKRSFCRKEAPACRIAEKFLCGDADRQAYLETVLSWIGHREGKSIESYMNEHRRDADAAELVCYFQSVIDWVRTVFPTYRKEMRSVAWGDLYNRYGTGSFDPGTLEAGVRTLMRDRDVTGKSGIYEYLLGGDERLLRIRPFSAGQKKKAYARQGGVCPHCVRDGFRQTRYTPEEMEAGPVTPWREGGRCTGENCRLLCRYHHRLQTKT